ncbi:hypothetical protein [Arenibaculum sp.]|uniref:hypothetical protein n=1 Tax=Arenibaculum sp. TaxID=2865862 RepID=UPI002E1181EC|nr:hypothetical protein [Arenibaculum sp.]
MHRPEARPELPDLDAAALVHVARAAAGAEPQAAWISGSHAQGIAHARSDVDLYVLVDGGGGGIVRTREGAQTVECDLWAAAAVDAVLDRLAAVDPSGASPDDLAAFGYDRLGLLHGLRIGIPVLGADAFEALRRRCLADRVAALIERRNSDRIAVLLDDAAGMQEAGNLLGACLRARDAVGIAVDLLLNRTGRVYINPKSRSGLIAGIGLDDGPVAAMVAAYLAIESRLPEAADGRAAYLERCRALVGSLLGAGGAQ